MIAALGLTAGRPSDDRRAAVFLDRDGTIIEDRHYIARPDQVALLPGAAESIGALNAAGILVIVISNQSGIGRGYFTRADFDAVQREVARQLALHAAHLDGVYVCEHDPEREPCECRKPGTQLHREAIAALGVDPSRSFFIGDRLRDVEPALPLGGRGILVPAADTPAAELTAARARFTVEPSLGQAVATVLAAR